MEESNVKTPKWGKFSDVIIDKHRCRLSIYRKPFEEYLEYMRMDLDASISITLSFPTKNYH
jgi:hypothetical protein